jgi:acetate kinase
VFTGGVGENSAGVRYLAAERLAHLGVAVHPARNDGDGTDRDITADGARARTFVIAAREDVEIAQETRAALSA